MMIEEEWMVRVVIKGSPFYPFDKDESLEEGGFYTGEWCFRLEKEQHSIL
ncbi:hypothetical protein GXN76_12980 [Kroppenstedtia pulmonis]|uniref:Uncharacterized protein n=1 Tax=Kroppenstedtia pulmonis TaxID=1380685 RepID=A0A7D4C852_9BACL|nr:hypothetical protein [Kroppenstedtia pulmonis]QKG85296.1 hypothetical protein GXN76_12980 [Kroppenstedtia pulmonis]